MNINRILHQKGLSKFDLCYKRSSTGFPLPKQTVITVVWSAGVFEPPHEDEYGITYGISVKCAADEIYIPKIGLTLAVRRYDQSPVRFKGKIETLKTEGQFDSNKVHGAICHSIFSEISEGNLNLFSENSKTKDDVLAMCFEFFDNSGLR